MPRKDYNYYNGVNKNPIKAYEKAVEQLAEYFINRYFSKEQEYRWIGDEIGGVLNVNDWFFNLLDIVDYIKHDYSTDEMLEYYDYVLDCFEKNKSPINIKNYKKMNKTNPLPRNE